MGLKNGTRKQELKQIQKYHNYKKQTNITKYKHKDHTKKQTEIITLPHI